MGSERHVVCDRASILQCEAQKAGFQSSKDHKKAMQKARLTRRAHTQALVEENNQLAVPLTENEIQEKETETRKDIQDANDLAKIERCVQNQRFIVGRELKNLLEQASDGDFTKHIKRIVETIQGHTIRYVEMKGLNRKCKVNRILELFAGAKLNLLYLNLDSSWINNDDKGYQTIGDILAQNTLETLILTKSLQQPFSAVDYGHILRGLAQNHACLKLTPPCYRQSFTTERGKLDKIVGVKGRNWEALWKRKDNKQCRRYNCPERPIGGDFCKTCQEYEDRNSIAVGDVCPECKKASNGGILHKGDCRKAFRKKAKQCAICGAAGGDPTGKGKKCTDCRLKAIKKRRRKRGKCTECGENASERGMPCPPCTSKKRIKANQCYKCGNLNEPGRVNSPLPCETCHADGVGPYKGRRRMAARLFPGRDSPVMTRLLDEIIAKQDA